MEQVDYGFNKCPICKHKVEPDVENGEMVYDCENCGLFIEETNNSTLVDFPQHNMIYINTNMSKREISRKLFSLDKRFTRARKAYNKQSRKHSSSC